MKSLRIPFSAGAVIRYHTARMIHKQTVAEHSWGVAMIVLWVCDGKPSAELLKAALLHDVPEIATGDIPAPVKWGNLQLSEALQVTEDQFCENHGLDYWQHLTIEEQRILKFADIMELVIFCVSEVTMGNKNAEVIAQRGLCYLAEKPWINERANALYLSLKEQLYEL